MKLKIKPYCNFYGIIQQTPPKDKHVLLFTNARKCFNPPSFDLAKSLDVLRNGLKVIAQMRLSTLICDAPHWKNKSYKQNSSHRKKYFRYKNYKVKQMAQIKSFHYFLNKNIIN
jgi:hypothetical protein